MKLVRDDDAQEGKSDEDKADEALRTEWLATGIDAGWLTGIFCYTHDSPPMTPLDELASEDDELDYCIWCVRMVETDD